MDRARAISVSAWAIGHCWPAGASTSLSASPSQAPSMDYVLKQSFVPDHIDGTGWKMFNRRVAMETGSGWGHSGLVKKIHKVPRYAMFLYLERSQQDYSVVFGKTLLAKTVHEPLLDRVRSRAATHL